MQTCIRQLHGVFDSIYWEIDSPSLNGRVTSNAYYNSNVLSVGSKIGVAELFVSTVRPTKNWCPERAAGGTCWFTKLTYKEGLYGSDAIPYNVAVNFSHVGKIYVGFGISPNASMRSASTSTYFRNLSLSFF